MHKPRTPWPLEERIRLVVTFRELQKLYPRLSAREFGKHIDVPYPTFWRWLRLYRTKGPTGLRDRSHQPRRRPHKLSGQEESLIRRAHRALACGVHRLYAYLRQANLSQRSFSSVYRVLRRCGALVRRKRRPRPNWHLYAKAWAGERAQMDLKYLPYGRYQLTLIDDCTRLTAAAVLLGRTQADVLHALPARLRRAFPFPLQCIQTDNGAEFERQVSSWLRGRGIRHTRIRPRTPHLNGKVERVQRTIQEEYWDGVTGPPGREWEEGLRRYLRSYNRERPHSALDYQTPWQYAQRRLAAGVPVSHIS